MNNEFKSKLTNTELFHYGEDFWAAMRGDNASFNKIDSGKNSMTGTFLLPSGSATKFATVLELNNVFRRIGTVISAVSSDAKIWLSDNTTTPEWVPEGGVIPVAAGPDFPKKPVNAHKLAVINTVDTDLVSDACFDLENCLMKQFGKRFGKAEEDAFINGTGVDMPTGILATADTGVTASGEISFDDVLALYFSVAKQYRTDGAWLMNDETALKLKTLKDENGQYLWNQNSDTILGKPVHISEFMPSEGKPIAFGDFSYYYIVDRLPLTVRTLHEKFGLQQKVGYLGVEYLDGLLIRPEAVKVLAAEQTVSGSAGGMIEDGDEF